MNDTRQRWARGQIVSFNSTTYQATVQLYPSLNNYLTLPVAKHIHSSNIAVGDSCAVLLFDETNPTDGLVMAVYGTVPADNGGNLFHTFSASAGRAYSNTAITNGLIVTGIAAPGVPAGALAAYCAVQSNPTAVGPLTLYPDGAADPGIANYEANVVGVLNIYYQPVPLSSAAKFSLHSYFAGQLYIDVWGYIL